MVLALFFVLSVTGVVGTVLYARDAHAVTNSTINFQARVLTAGGAVIPDGTVSVQFNIYNVASGGTAQWTETQGSLTSKNGYITASLGAITPFPGTIDWSQEQWLTMNVNGDGEMGPTRMKITAVPYSFRSGQADTLTNGSGTISASQLAQLAPGSIQGVSSANTALRINQTGAGSLLQLQSGGVDKLTVANNGDTSIGGALTVNSGLTVGNSTSTTAGTIRWTGSAFEGYNGSAWTSLGGGLVLSSGASASFVSGLQNVAANTVNGVLETMVFTSATAISNVAGPTGFTAPAAGSFRTCLVQNNAAITAGTLDLRWRVNGVRVGAAACSMSAATNRQSSTSLNAGVVTFNAGDTIDVSFDTSAGFLPTGTNDFTVYWSVEYNSSSSSLTLQKVYDSSSAPVTVVTADNKDVKFTLSNTATDSNFLIDIATGSTSKFAVQNNGTDIFNVNTSGGVSVTGALSVSGQTTLSGNLAANGSATGTTGTTTGTGSNTTTLTLTADAFSVNDVVLIDNAGQDYYTRITADPGTGTYTVSPAVTFENTRTVTKYTVQNIGATSTDYTTRANRFFQGYFLGGVVTGAGSTTLSDGNLYSTTDLVLQKDGGLVQFGGNVNVTGSITGNGSGITNIDGSQISGGSIGDASLSSNVTLLGNTFNGNNQLLQLNGSGALPALNAANLTSLNATNISSGTLADTRLTTNVTLLGNAFNGVSQLVQLNGSGALPTLSGANLTTLNGSNISSGTVADARLSGNVTLAGNTFNGANGLVQLDGSGNLTALNGGALTSLNATNISSGTLADARLSSNVTLLGNSFNGNNQLVQLDGSGELPALNASALTSINGSNISSGTLGDSRLSGNVTLLGNAFNGVSQLVQLNGSGALPTLSGANLTTLNGSNISSGTVADARLSGNVTLAGNTFNGANGLVQLDGSGNLTALNGGALTSLNATNISSGTLADARLSSNVTLLGNSFNGNNQLVQLDGSGALPALNAGALTTLNATNVASGTLGDARLSSNVSLLGTSQTYTALKTFAANIALGTDTGSPTAGLITLNDATASNGFTSVLGTSALSANRNINLPDEAGTICLISSTACGFALIGPAAVQTDSSTNPSLFINKTGASGNMLTLQKNGTTVLSILNTGALQIQLDSTSAFSVKDSGGTDDFSVDTTGALVRIGSATADANATLLVLDTKNTAGDPTGTNGGSYYNSASGKSRCYENGIWQDCVSAINRNKAADQTVTNNATFQNDSALVYAMAANSSYAIEATINYSTTSAAADFKYTFTVPAGATIYLATDADTAATTRTICNITASGQTCALANTANFRGIIKVKGVITTTGTAGNLQFQFAQNTGTAAQSVTVYKGSILSVSRTDQ